MRDASSGRYQPDDAARLAATSNSDSDDAEPTPQARDEDTYLVSSEEYTNEPDTANIEDWKFADDHNPFIRVPVRLYVSDVVEPGYQVTVDATDGSAGSTAADADAGDEADEPTVPDAYPDPSYRGLPLSTALERWLSRSAITSTSFERDFSLVLERTLTDAVGRRGTGLVEHVYHDPTERKRLLGLRPFGVEDVTAYTRAGKAILLRPDDTADTLARSGDDHPFEAANAPTLGLGAGDRDTLPKTRAGKTAALVQFDDVFGVSEKEEIAFALDDVTIYANDPDTGAVFGRPETATVVPRAKALLTQLEDVDQALKNAAWNNLVANVDTDSKDEAEEMLAALKPNSPETVSVTNTNPDITELDGQVPDVTDHIKQQIEFIVAGLPVPLYRVGFEGDINRDVTSEQSDDYPRQLARERQRLEAAFRPALELKACEFMTGHAHPADSEGDLYGDPADVPDVFLRVRADDTTSPLESEHFDEDAFLSFVQALKAAAPGGQVSQLVELDALLSIIPGFDPEEVMPEAAGDLESEMALDSLDDADPAVQETFADIMGEDMVDVEAAALATRYSEGDEVDTPAGVGVVVEIRTEPFTAPDGEEVEPTDDSPAYIVAVEEGAKVYSASDLSEGTIDVDGVGDPADALQEAEAAFDIAEATGGDVTEISELVDDGRTFDYPESWRKSETPNRIILLKAWAGLGGRFTSCRRKMAGDVAAPSRFCASMKDAVLNWEGWRQ